MLKRKIAHVLTAAAVSMGAIVVTADPARADVVVPPRKSGHICSNYSNISDSIKWQTCAWADSNELYFTVNFSNATSRSFSVDEIYLGYVVNGLNFPTCTFFFDFVIPAKSNRGTDTAACAYPRDAAYATQAQATVFEDDFGYGHRFQRSDSLQAQY